MANVLKVWGFRHAHFVGHSFGSFLVSWMLRYQPKYVESPWPQKNQFSKLEIPEELNEEPYFLDHTLVPPLSTQKISGDREGFGNHFGTINFKGEDPDRMKELLLHYETVDFYV